MELKDTIQLMQSNLYEDRLKAEYIQLKIRLNELTNYLEKAQAGEKKPAEIEVLKAQKRFMLQYLYILEIRADIENINLGGK